jgi:hypothetical protein
MGELQGTAYVLQDRDGFLPGHRPVLLDVTGQVTAFDQLHCQTVFAFDSDDVVDVEKAGVIEFGPDPGFVEKCFDLLFDDAGFIRSQYF